jgi:hypothetical protein
LSSAFSLIGASGNHIIRNAPRDCKGAFRKSAGAMDAGPDSGLRTGFPICGLFGAGMPKAKGRVHAEHPGL